MAIRHSLALVMCCVFCVATACGKKEQAKVYKFHGTVVRLDPANNVAAIHNEKVTGWMGEMTMEYPVESKDEFRSLRAGEKIAAEVNVTTDRYWLTNVHEDAKK